MKKSKIAKMALAVLSIMTISATGASLAACGGKKHSHKYGDWAIVETRKPTLEEGGLAERFCTSNDGGRQTYEVPALADSDFWTKTSEDKATHTTEGSATYSSDYGTVTITLPKTDEHNYGNWSFVEKKEPTMTEGGEITRVCGGDSTHTETKTVAALSDTTEWTRNIITQPTHQSAGYADFTHKTYGVKMENVRYAEQQEHTFAAWEFTVEPTLTTPGKAVHVCTEDGCADDPSATKELDVPALNDTTFWTKGAHVEADYNHAESDTYTNEAYEISFKHVTAPKWVVVYDGKTYHSVNLTVSDSGNVSVGTSWNEASLAVNEDSIGFGDRFPFMGKFVFELMDPVTGLVKITKYDKISTSTGTGGEGGDGWGDGGDDSDYDAEGYSLREGDEYSDTPSGTFYAYVDMTSGALVLQNNNSWGDIHVAIPTDEVLSSGNFTASSCKGDFIIAYNKNGTSLNMLVMGEDGAAFDVVITDLNGNALTAANCFTAANTTGTVLVKKDGSLIKAYAKNVKGEWVVADGLQGTYKNGADTIVVDGAASVKVGGVSYAYEVVSNTSDSKVIGAIIDNVYYEYTLSGDGISANGGTYTEEAPKVTVTYDFKGVTPNGTIPAVNEVSKKVPLTLVVPENEEMHFIGWYTDAACTKKVVLTDDKFVPTADVTLYAKWSAKVTITIKGLIGGETKTINAGDGEEFGDVIKIYTKNQVDETTRKYFTGWYFEDTDKLLSDTDIIDGDMTIVAKWEDVHALYGEYTGKQLLSSGTVKQANITVSAIGEITGTMDTSTNGIKTIDGVIDSYNTETQVVIWIPNNDITKSYRMWFDADSGLLIIPSDLADPDMGSSPVLVSLDGVIGENESIRYSPTGASESGKNKLIQYGDGKLAMMYENHIYSDVTLTDVFGTEFNFDNVLTTKTLIVSKGEEQVFAVGSTGDNINARNDEFGNTAVIKELDEYYGIYNADGIEFRLDGVGNVIWNDGKDKAGIYSFLSAKDDGNTIVLSIYERTRKVDTETSEDDDGDTTTTTTVTYTNVAYHELTLGTTNSFTTPEVTITFVSAQTSVDDAHVNKNIVYKPEALENTETHVFRGWYLDENFNEAVGENYTPVADGTLYAKWLEKVTVTVEYNNGDDGASNVVVHEYGKNETVNLERPVRNGFSFKGWFTDAAFENEWENNVVITENISIFVKWSDPPVYTGVNYHYLAMSQDGVGSGTNANGTGHWIGRMQFNVEGLSTDGGYPIAGNSQLSNFDEVAGTLTFTNTNNNVKGERKGFIDVNSRIVVVAWDTDAFNKIIIFTPEYADYKESYWNKGATKTISFTLEGKTYGIFVNNGNVYFNVSFENANGDTVAANAAYQSETLYVKNAAGGLIAKFGYDGSVMNELDGYEDITYTGAMGELTVNGVATITLDGVAGTYSLNKADGATYTADAYIGGSYYEVTLDKANSTYTIVKRMVTVTFVTDFDKTNAVSGEKNKNIAFDLPVLTDANNVFRGWYVEGAETQLLSGEYIPVAGVTLHAKWDKKVTLTVVYGNGLEQATLVYGAGDTTAPVEPKFTNGQAFNGWYIDSAFTTPYTVGAITENTTIYCKWIGAVAMYGNYYGWNLYGKDSNTISATTTSSTKLLIAADGTVTGTKSGSVVRDPDYDPETGIFYIVNGSSTYYLVYDTASGAIGVAYGSSATNFNEDMYLLFNKLIKSGENSATLGMGGNMTGGKIVSVTFADDTKANLFVTNTRIYSGVTWTATNSLGEVTEYTAKDVGNASTVTVYDSDGNVLINRGKSGTDWKDLDGSQGTYTNGDDSFTLNGVGGIVWNGKSGTYTAAPAGSDYTYDVKFSDAFYHVTITGKTFTAVKPMATITFDLGGKGTNITHSQNLNIELNLRNEDVIANPTADGFVFKGWYSGEGGTGSQVYDVKPTTTDTITLYAKWAQTFILTAVYNDGSADGKFSYEENTTASLGSIKPSVLYREGKHFAGWYAEDTFTTPVSSLTMDGNKTIYAKWEEGAYVVTPMAGSYGFVYDNEKGYYASNNQGQNSTSAVMTITVFEGGTLTFKYQASSEAADKWDYLKISLNGSQKATAGENKDMTEPTSWNEFEMELKAGDVITITYIKDSSGVGGADTGWVKDIVFTEA